MKQKIQITIPEPCQENWQNMTPVEKGRFCASCQKTVLDFTQLSDNEIANIINKKEYLCGRFTANQLDRNLIETKRTSNYFGYFATSVLAFLGFGTSNVVAQVKPIQEQTDNKYQYKPTDTIKEITVSGIVKDIDGRPLQGTSVIIKGTNKGVQSDELGKYNIKASIGDTLTFSYLEFETIEFQIIKDNYTFDVIMMPSSNEIHTIGIYIIKKRTFFGRTFSKIGNWFR